MENKVILVDTSILIDYFRKSDKENSQLIGLKRKGYQFKISAITEYEIYAGSSDQQKKFWEGLLERIEVLAFDQETVKAAVEINRLLKQKSKQLDLADLFIGATSISYNLPLATLNKKHFERIENLEIVG